MNRTQGRGDGERHDAEQDNRDGQDKRRRTAESEARDHADQTGYRPSVNQRRHEPMPASRHDDLRQEAVVRNEEHAHGGERQVRPSPRAPAQRGRQRDDG
jgi:hypothetical protein